jgi:quinol monooxygenase YgiN
VVTIYCTFEVPAEKASAFDEWFGGLASECQGEDGCIAYDFLLDPSKPTGRALVEVWETEAHLDAHRVFPAHVEMLALGGLEWGMTNLVVHTWKGGVHAKRTADAPGDSHSEELARLVRERQREAGVSAPAPV